MPSPSTLPLVDRIVPKSGPAAKPRRSRRVAAPKFLSAVVQPSIQEMPIVLELAGGHVVKLPPSTPMSQLVELVVALSGRGVA
jgi:hypothetical protein